MLSAEFSIVFGWLALFPEQTNSMVISEAMRAHLLNLGGGRPMIISSVYLPDLVWCWYGSSMVYLPDLVWYWYGVSSRSPNVVTHHLARPVYYPPLLAVSIQLFLIFNLSRFSSVLDNKRRQFLRAH